MQLMLWRYGEAINSFAKKHEARFGNEITTDLKKAAAILQGDELCTAERRSISERLFDHVVTIGCLAGKYSSRDTANWRLVVCSLASRVLQCSLDQREAMGANNG
jgi:hypothetical protein